MATAWDKINAVYQTGAQNTLKEIVEISKEKKSKNPSFATNINPQTDKRTTAEIDVPFIAEYIVILLAKKTIEKIPNPTINVIIKTIKGMTS